MNATTPRVLQVSRSVIDGGFDYHAEIARGLVDRGAEVVSVFQRGRLDRPRRAAFPGRAFSLDAARRRLYKRPAGLAMALWRAVGGRPQDLAICHHLTPARAVQLLLRLGLVKRAILVVHDYDYFDPGDRHGRRRNRFLSRVLRHPWRLVGVSEAICRNVCAQVAALPAERCRVIHNAIDAAALEARLLAAPEARRALGLRATDFVFGTVGRLVDFKAHDDLIEAFAQVRREMPQARLMIVGRGPLEAGLRAQVAAAGLEEQVLIHGFLDDAARYMRAFDCFVLPSRDEPFGLVLLEAMVARLPVLASDSGAPAEVLPAGSRLFPTGEPAALAQRLLAAYRQPPAERAALGEAGYRHARERFALQRYRASYADLLDSPPGAA